MIKVGTLLLHPKSGPTAAILSLLMRLIDPDPWVRQNYKIWGQYWHLSFVTGLDPKTHDWIVRSVEGHGIKYRLLSSFKARPIPFNWLNTGPDGADQDKVDDYKRNHSCMGYDTIGYVQCATNRLSRGLIPAMRNRFLYCWEDVSMFCDAFNQPWTPYYKMPYMPVLIKLRELLRHD